MGNNSSITLLEPQNHRQDDQHYAFTCEMCFKPVTISNNEVEISSKFCTNCMLKSEEQIETATFTCQICFESMTIANKKFKNSNICAHPFCTECIIRYIQVKVDQDKVSDIKCPDTHCKYSLGPLPCRLILTNLLFDKWCDVLCESAVLGVVDRVYCPNRECMELILNECGDRKVKRCVCPCCKEPFCFGCKVSWHDGYSCKQSKKMIIDENDVAFAAVYKKNKWRKCPKCRHCVERVDGCDQMTCRCGTNFCYICGRQGCDHRLLRNFRLTMFFLVLLFILVEALTSLI